MHAINLSALQPKNQDIKLNIEVCYPDDKNQFTVIFFAHGWGSSALSASNYYQALTDIGFAVAAVELRGHGKSSSHLDWSNKEFFSDLLLAYDYVEALPQTKSIIVNGSSWGGYLTACLTKERTPRSIVLRVPANYPDSFWDSRKDSSEVSSEDLKHSQAIEALKNYSGDVLVVESGDDEIIPSWMVDTYVQARSDIKHVLMPKAPHALGRDVSLHKQYLDIIVPFFQENDIV